MTEGWVNVAMQWQDLPALRAVLGKLGFSVPVRMITRHSYR
jgi:hypothetical protein